MRAVFLISLTALVASCVGTALKKKKSATDATFAREVASHSFVKDWPKTEITYETDPPPQKLPSQGFDGKDVHHPDKETATSDWGKEFGPKRWWKEGSDGKTAEQASVSEGESGSGSGSASGSASGSGSGSGSASGSGSGSVSRSGSGNVSGSESASGSGSGSGTGSERSGTGSGAGGAGSGTRGGAVATGSGAREGPASSAGTGAQPGSGSPYSGAHVPNQAVAVFGVLSVVWVATLA